MKNTITAFVATAAIAIASAHAQSAAEPQTTQAPQPPAAPQPPSKEQRQTMIERLKAQGRDVKIIEQHSETNTDGSPATTRGKIIVIDKDEKLTETEITDANKAEIGKEIEVLLNEDGTDTKSKRVIINSTKSETVTTSDDGTTVNISTSNSSGGKSIGNGNSRAVVIRSSKGGRCKGSCAISINSDSTAIGKAYAISIDGVDESLRSELKELKSHLTELRGELKGLDSDVQDKVKAVLKNLKINVNMPDSLMVFSINANDNGADGVHADIKAFIANDDIKVLTPTDGSASVTTSVSENNGTILRKHIYVIRSKKNKNASEKTIETETLNAKDGLNLNEFSMFPNPTDDGRFTLKFSLPTEGVTSVRITDMNGREIASESLGNFTGTYEKLHDLSSFGKGVYLIGITQNGKTATMKVVTE